MPFKFEKLWNLIDQKGLTRTQLRDKIGASQTTITNMGKNENVPLNVIDKICSVLNCTPDDIMEYVKPYPDNGMGFLLRKGNIVFADFGDPIGREYGGNRLAVVIDRDNLNATTFIAPLITTPPTPSDTDIFCINSNHMLCKGKASIVLNKMRSVSKSRINAQCGRLNDSEIQEMDKVLKEFFISRFLRGFD